MDHSNGGQCPLTIVLMSRPIAGHLTCDDTFSNPYSMPMIWRGWRGLSARNDLDDNEYEREKRELHQADGGEQLNNGDDGNKPWSKW